MTPLMIWAFAGPAAKSASMILTGHILVFIGRILHEALKELAGSGAYPRQNRRKTLQGRGIRDEALHRHPRAMVLLQLAVGVDDFGQFGDDGGQMLAG